MLREGLTASASTGLLLFGGTYAQAQTTLDLPGGTQGYANVITGAQGTNGPGTTSHPQAGGQGGILGSLAITLTGALSGNAGGSTVQLGLVGGLGGTGNDVDGSNIEGQGDSSYAGAGGLGGTTGLLNFNVNSGTSITSGSGGGPAITMTNQGGKGGLGGDHVKTYGYTGSPGNGALGGEVQLNLYGDVTAQTAWSGNTPGATAIVLRSLGGDAGGSLDENGGLDRQSAGHVPGRAGGAGANGGHIQFGLGSASVTSAGSAVVALSQGGNGSMGAAAEADDGCGISGCPVGGPGGNGGDGGRIDTVVYGNGTQMITAIGGPAAATGAVVPISDDGKTTAQAAALAAGLQLQSLGGVGAAGNTGDGEMGSGKGGAGGNAGSGNFIGLNSQGVNISTTGFAAMGVLAQSVGGPGGNGAGAGGVFGKRGGSGGKGGNGGPIELDFSDATTQAANSLIHTAGDDSGAVVAQSIGGGGGAGGSVVVGSVIAGIAIGGESESGGTAGTVTVNNGHVDGQSKLIDNGVLVQTEGTRSAGIIAQSIGGGGGIGGSAQSTVAGVFSMAIGGKSGSGGTAGARGTTQVSVYNRGIVQTGGDHSEGVVAQAIGGGGGSGGSASALDVGGQATMSLSVGGNGGTGGDAGDVKVTNDGQIVTEGADSWGVLAQSIGGGGGNGGASKAETVQIANSKEAPSFNATTSVGGQGGTGGNAGNVTAGSSFSIMTAGKGSHGLMAQSLGGGGGNGGDSTAIQSNVQASTFNFSLSIGGSGGSAGTGGAVTVNNSGLIWTLGYGADGIFAQSVGGGGGNGGYGNSDTSSFRSASTDKSSEFTLAIGGGGGTGNTGGSVTVTNNSGIITRGDRSRGITAQSIGGSGGNGGGAVGNGTGGKVSVNVSVGGAGGAGNDGGFVQVTNNGIIYTTGAAADGIFAQSVGGGGGSGGSASSGGGTDPEVRFADYLANSAGISQSVQDWGNRIYAWKDNTHGDFDVLDKLKSWVTDYDGNNSAAKPPEDGPGGGDFNLTLDVGGGAGGKGGSGGNSLGVTVINTKAIVTTGPGSKGIVAQSVGGGGGDGGAVLIANNPVNSPKNLSALLGLGGHAGSAGDGAIVDVENHGTITTSGDQSHGILAQSVGGGGGSGGATTTQAGAVHDLAVNFGGDGGSSGNGSSVIVQSVANANFPGPVTITTMGNDAVGIAAQSIGGGGGNVAIMHTETDPGTGGAVSHSTSYNQFTLADIGFGGKTSNWCGGSHTNPWAATCGNALMAVVAADTVTTIGRNAHGIVAQSIGGGGGWVVGGTVNSYDFFSAFNNGVNANGSGGNVAVIVNKALTTSGDGAIGILAQSVGGAGLLAGDFASQENSTTFTKVNRSSSLVGNGGAVSVTLAEGASLTTSGASAFGVFAQSVGGGGGMVAGSDGLTRMGTAGGQGVSGTVDVNINGTLTTTGIDAMGVYVNADGGTVTPNAVNVTVGAKGSVIVRNTGGLTSAIVINSSAPSNTVTNNGTISAPLNSVDRAVLSVGSQPVNVINNGSITGSVNLGTGTLTLVGLGTNVSSTWAPGLLSTAGRVINNAEIDLSDTSTYFLSGTLENHDLIATPADFAAGKAGTLHATTAIMGAGSWIGIEAQTLAPNPVTVVSADSLQVTGTITARGVGGVSQGQPGAVDQFLYNVTTPNNSVVVTPVANLSNAAASLGTSANQQGIAAHLDQGFTTRMAPGMAATYAGLASMSNKGSYLRALDSLGNEGLQSVGTTRLTASHAFVERMNSCPQFEQGSTEMRERDCIWGRVIGNQVNRRADDANVGYKQNNSTVQFGGQKAVDNDWFVGGSISRDTSDTNEKSGHSSLDGKGFSAGLILKRQLGDWLISGALDAGRGSYDSIRRIQLGSRINETATGAFNAWHMGLHSRIARQFAMQGWYVKPYLDLHATHIRTSGYAESGAGNYNLQVSRGSDNMFAASPMVELGGRNDFGNGLTLRSYASAGVTFYGDNEWRSNARLTGTAPEARTFESAASLPSQRFKLNTGVELMTRSNLSLRLEYTGEFARAYRSNTASVKFNYLF